MPLSSGVIQPGCDTACRYRLGCVGRLIALGELPEDYQILHFLVSAEEGIAISLAENSGREPMQLADVFAVPLEMMKKDAATDAAVRCMLTTGFQKCCKP